MYNIEILTASGVKNVIFDPNNQTVEELEKELTSKYGTFITIKSTKT